MNVTDTFDRADASTLGTTSDGLATWTYRGVGAFGIASNQAKSVASGGGGQTWAAVDTSQGDGTVQVTMAVVTANVAGLAFRVSGSGDFWGAYWGQLIKCVAGSVSTVGSTYTAVSGDVLSVVLSGATITVKVNGTTVSTVTDSFNQTATQHGIFANSSTMATDGSRWDNWSFVGAAAPASRVPRPVVIRSRAVTRAAVI